MPQLIEVAFRGNRKEFFLWDGADPPRLQAAIVVEGDRGEDMGRVHATGELAAQRFAGVAHGAPTLGTGAQPTRRALRLATAEELARAEELPALNEEARRRTQERVKAHQLVMKVSDADWQWDRRKLTIYFTAEKRVDFRGLVRDLAALFRTRIELKQIGVRDEAKRLDGIGRCGRQYCSASWLPELRPVNLSVAKDQRLSLNPTQISGACGRLMCSLRYEHEFYVAQRKRFPKEGKVLVTAKGEEKVVANDIFRERVTLRALDGEVRVVPLADLRAELEALGGAVGPFGGGIGAGAPAGDEGAEPGEDRRAPGLEGIVEELLATATRVRREERPRRDGPREGSRDGSRDDARDGARDGGRDGSREGPRGAGSAGRGGERRGPDRRDGDRRLGERRDGDVARTMPAPLFTDPRDAELPPPRGVVPPEARLPTPASRDVEGADDEDATDLDATDDGEDGAEGDAVGLLPDGTPRPRRRRGRRGGRRNRGGRAGLQETGEHAIPDAAGGPTGAPDAPRPDPAEG